MKIKIFFFLWVMISVSGFTQEQHAVSPGKKGYTWQAGVAFGATFTDNNPTAIVELFTTHGYQFSRRIFLGAGVSTYSTETINLYILGRFNFGKIRDFTSNFPYFALRGGMSWSTWTGDHWGDDKGPIIDPMLGWSFYTPEGKLRWNVYLSPGFYQFEFIPKAGLCFEF